MDSASSRQPTQHKPKTPYIKIALRIITATAVSFFVILLIVVHHRTSRTLVVQRKPDAEIANLPISTDAYPCLLIEGSESKKSSARHPSIQQCSPALNNDANIEQYVVDLRTGIFILRQTDLFVSDTMPLALTRCYRLWDNYTHAFGVGGNHPYDMFPAGDHFPYTYMDLILGDGIAVHYSRISRGTNYDDFVAEHNGSPATVFQKSQVRWNKDRWDVTFADGTLYQFPDSYNRHRAAEGGPITMRNAQGDEITFVRDDRRNLKSLTSPHHRQITFTHDERDRVTQAADDRGRIINYSYDPTGRLIEVRENGAERWSYSYVPAGIVAVHDAAKREVLSLQYSQGRTSAITIQQKTTYHFDYLFGSNGRVVETTVSDPTGKKSIFKFWP